MKVSTKFFCILIGLSAYSVFVSAKNLHPLSDEFISEINNKQNLWEAGRNFHEDTPLSYLRNLMGTKLGSTNKLAAMNHSAELIDDLPENFDARDKWPHCPSLNEIRDQANCGSCWAFGAVETMTDRVCTYSNGSQNFHFSAEDLLACCPNAGDCNGGSPWLAWEFWIGFGIVSGGAYNSKEGCRPYEIEPCSHDVNGSLPPCGDLAKTPDCKESCLESYKLQYKEDKHSGKTFYTVKGEDHIRAEIFTNGPVQASFTVYDDFVSYKKGVYKRTSGEDLGGHSVKILGWGVENGTKYWLVANSWNSEWGDKGFFRILRGKDECGIESYILGGKPKLANFK